MRLDLDHLEQQRIDRAVKAAGARFGLVLAGAGVATAATQIGARIDIEIDPATGFPVEPDMDDAYFPGDYPNDGAKELS